MLKEIRLPSKENWEEKKKKTFGVACTGREREREDKKHERRRATRAAGICCRCFQAHRFAKTRPTISCRALALKKISWKNKKKKKKQHKNNKNNNKVV